MGKSARDTAKHPTMQKTVPTTNNYPVQRESSSQVCENISSIGTPTEATFIPQIFQWYLQYQLSFFPEGSSAPQEFQLVNMDFKWLI